MSVCVWVWWLVGLRAGVGLRVGVLFSKREPTIEGVVGISQDVLRNFSFLR